MESLFIQVMYKLNKKIKYPYDWFCDPGLHTHTHTHIHIYIYKYIYFTLLYYLFSFQVMYKS